MKFKTTQKAIKESHIKVYSVGYCNLQSLFNDIDPIAYTTRIEGWGCDIYSFGTIAITTGYAPFGQSIDYKLIREYEKKAQKIQHDYKRSWDSKKRGLKRLRNNFINKL
jgi:hypothetical protein